MHRPETVARALELAASGASTTSVAASLGLPRSTVRDWLAGRTPAHTSCTSCERCGAVHDLAELDAAYVCLLGLYLGDGCISAHARGVFRLRITLDVAYPQIIAEAAQAIYDVRARAAHVMQRESACVQLSSYWRRLALRVSSARRR